MKINVEKALQVCGNNNRYQKLLFIAVALTWFSVDFVSISFPLLEFSPNFKCRNGNESSPWKDCSAEEMCTLPQENVNADIVYKTMITDYQLWCQKTLVILIGVVYTLGIVVGAFLASKFSDLLGRKNILLICHFLFACGGLSITFAPSIYFILGILFFIGISCAGGTMVSFLYIYEVLAANKRSIYGTLINSAFAIAGMIYFTVFRYTENWKYLAYMCSATDIIAALLVLLYFTESPRYFLSKGQTDKFLKALDHIAKKNGKSKDYYKFLGSDVSFQGDAEYNKDLRSNLVSNNSDEKEVNNRQNINYNTSSSSSKSTNLDSPHLKSHYEDLVKGLGKRGSIESESDQLNKDKDEPFLSQSETSEVVSNISIRQEDNSNFQSNKESPFSALVKYKSLRWNFLICCYMWFAMAFTYYGISMGLKQSKDQVFIDGYVVYGAEGVSYMITGIIISLAFFGRIRSLSIMMLITSVSTCGYFWMKKLLSDPEPFDKILLFLARFGITAIFSIMYTYSTEIYPTSIRAKGLGINTLFARLAAILVPIIVELFNPFLIYSSLCFIGFILSFYLPETFGKDLEDEILEERAAVGSGKKVYSDY